MQVVIDFQVAVRVPIVVIVSASGINLHKPYAPFDQSAGLALSTIRRRLSTLAGFYSHLVALGEMDHNPVQRGMPVRSPVSRDRRVIPLIRPVRHLPQILDHDDVLALGGQAFYGGMSPSRPMTWVRNNHHAASTWLRAFRGAGLAVEECIEEPFSDDSRESLLN